MPHEPCTDIVGDDERTSVVSHDQESSAGDGEDAVILTARRVRIVRCCRAKKTTLSSVSFLFAMSRGTQPADGEKGVVAAGLVAGESKE